MNSKSKKKEMERRLKNKNARREVQRERKKNEAIILGIVGSRIPSSITINGLLARKTAVPKQKEVVIPENETTRFIKKIANNVWKLRNKMFDADGNPKDGFEKVYRPVDALWDALKEIDVTVKSHDGEMYDTGMPVNVIAWDKREGATREEIIETLKPTIRLGDQLLQWADVIAVAPVKAETALQTPTVAEAAPVETTTVTQTVSEQPTINLEESNKGE